MPRSDSWDIIREYVELQRNYLRSPLPAYPWICPTCRGVRTVGYPLCFACQAHYTRARGVLADLVLPISYSPRTGQHHHSLRTYKGISPPAQVRWNLLALLLLFLRHHRACLAAAMGGEPTHVITVPSTRGRAGPHPLDALCGERLGLTRITAVAKTQYGAGEREFQADWFAVDLPGQDEPMRPLILDDTWTTGARAQSLAHALKTAGAESVAVVVLGRHVNPDHAPSAPLLTAIAGQLFDPSVCVLELDPDKPLR